MIYPCSILHVYIYTHVIDIHVCMYVCMYLSIYVCMYVCIYVSMYLCIDVSMYLCMHVCMYACMHVCMYACMHVCMYACMHVCMYACMHVCMYACMHVCMHACMHACMYACMYVYKPVLYISILNRVGTNASLPPHRIWDSSAEWQWASRADPPVASPLKGPNTNRGRESTQLIWKNSWLVVDLPLWKIWKSVGVIKTLNIWKNIKNVPNHQPDRVTCQIIE